MGAKQENNVYIQAKNRSGKSQLDIVLFFSGKEEFVTSCRHNALVYLVLKDKISLASFRRWKPHTRTIRSKERKIYSSKLRKLELAMKRIGKDVDRYLEARELFSRAA